MKGKGIKEFFAHSARKNVDWAPHPSVHAMLMKMSAVSFSEPTHRKDLIIERHLAADVDIDSVCCKWSSFMRQLQSTCWGFHELRTFWSGEKPPISSNVISVQAEIVLTCSSLIRAGELICVRRTVCTYREAAKLDPKQPPPWERPFHKDAALLLSAITRGDRKGWLGLQNTGERISLNRRLYLHRRRRRRLSHLSRFYRNHSSGLDDPTCLLLSLSKIYTLICVLSRLLILLAVFVFISLLLKFIIHVFSSRRTPRWSYFSYRWSVSITNARWDERQLRRGFWKFTHTASN